MQIAQERANEYEHGLGFMRVEKGAINLYDKCNISGKKERNPLTFSLAKNPSSIWSRSEYLSLTCSSGRAVKILFLTQVCIPCSPPNASASLDINYFLVVAVSVVMWRGWGGCVRARVVRAKRTRVNIMCLSLLLVGIILKDRSVCLVVVIFIFFFFYFLRGF